MEPVEQVERLKEDIAKTKERNQIEHADIQRDIGKLDGQIIRLDERLRGFETASRDNERIHAERFASIESKMERLMDSINIIRNDVSKNMVKIGFFTAIGLLVGQIVISKFLNFG